MRARCFRRDECSLILIIYDMPTARELLGGAVVSVVHTATIQR
jgi:hypothetical protein